VLGKGTAGDEVQVSGAAAAEPELADGAPLEPKHQEGDRWGGPGEGGRPQRAAQTLRCSVQGLLPFNKSFSCCWVGHASGVPAPTAGRPGMRANRRRVELACYAVHVQAGIGSQGYIGCHLACMVGLPVGVGMHVAGTLGLHLFDG
jgi:hypothetical protein